MESLPAWLPDETLFSLASRHHRLACHRLAETTSLKLFGVRQSGTLHDFPAGIDHLVAVSKGRLGSADDIIRNHTLLPFYLPFQSEEAANQAEATLRGPKINSLKFRLGLLTSRFRANHPLKSCAACRAEDVERYGIAYWHRVHQWPGVWVCPVHGNFLASAQVKVNGVGRFLWFLPEPSIMAQEPFADLEPETVQPLRNTLEEFCRLIIGYTALPAGFRFDRQQLIYAYRGQIGRHGWLTSHGSLRLATFAAKFLECFAGLRILPEFMGLPATYSEAYSQLARLLKPFRTGTHPLRHLTLMLFLFEDWRSFHGVYQETSVHVDSIPADSPPASAHSVTSEPRRSRLVDLLANHGCSVRKAAETLGISIETAMHWAAKEGIAVRRRPKTLAKEKRQQVSAALLQGMSKFEAAAQFELSPIMINRILQGEPCLHDRWKAAVLEKVRICHRAKLSALCSEHPEWTRTQIRAQFNAGYAWLYRHDRSWLYEHLPSAQTSAKSNFSTVDWEARDREYEAALTSAYYRLIADMPEKPITRKLLINSVPEL